MEKGKKHSLKRFSELKIWALSWDSTKFHLCLTVKHDNSSEKSKIFQALSFSKKAPHVLFHVQRTIIQIEFYDENA